MSDAKPDLRVPPNLPADAVRRNRELSAWHFEWVDKHPDQADQESPAAQDEYYARAREIMGIKAPQ